MPEQSHAPGVAVVGLSFEGACGVQDHTTLLTSALTASGIPVHTQWLVRHRSSLLDARTEVRGWTGSLGTSLRTAQPGAVVVQYSVFSYSHRGVPLFVPTVFSAVRDLGIPVVTFLHEFAYRWRGGGWRGTVWAATQRLSLVQVMRHSDAVIVTTEQRRDWILTRRWLPRRPIRVTPVFSNLPKGGGTAPPAGRPTVGIFGYAYEGVAVTAVLDALSILRRQGCDVPLLLMGSPGPDSDAARLWLTAARDRGLASEVKITGFEPAQQLADRIATCSVLVFPDSRGPSSRKGTLAAALGSGRPVVAVDGPDRWDELVQADAVQLVAPDGPALAHGIKQVLQDAGRAEGLAGRAHAFAAAELTVERTAEVVVQALGDAGVHVGARADASHEASYASASGAAR